MTLSVALDLRWLQRAWLVSPAGALGGVGIFSQNLLKGLAEAAPEDFRLLGLVSREPVPVPLRDLLARLPGAQFRRVGLTGLCPPLDRRRKYVQALNLLESETGLAMPLAGVDVVHMLDHTPPPRGRRCPAVVTLHEFFAWVRPGWWAYRRMCDRLAAAERVVAVSRAVGDDYCDRHAPAGTAVRVVHNGIDTGVFRPGGGEGDGEGLPARFVMHAGVLTARKNPEGLIAAFARTVRERGDADLRLVSVGAYGAIPGARAAVEAIAARHGVADRLMVLADGAGPARMAALYRRSLGLVFPSLSEGFGLPAVEVLACGVPCVVSGTGGLPEVTGRLGILVDPRDPASIAAGLARMLDDEAHREHVRREGPRHAEGFSCRAMAEGYLAVYRALAGRR